MRIIAGKWRRRVLPVPDLPGLRPTPDRVRETLFNWLAPELPGARCLDLFAGTGALGFEAASRGAARVVLVERSAAVARHLSEQARTLDADGEHLEVVCSDAVDWLRRAREPFDVIFVDPPYGSLDLPELLDTLETGGHVARHGRVFVESPAGDHAPPVPAGWHVLRDQKAGRVRYHLATPPDRGA